MSEALPQSAETVIVGAGMAGLAVAAEMRGPGSTEPLVLEAGPDLGADHYRVEYGQDQADHLWLEPAADPLFWQPYESTNAHFASPAGLRRRVGGRSLYWHGVVLPIDETVLSDVAWPAPVVDDLCRSWRGGAGLYELVTRHLEQWTGRPLRPGARPDLPLDLLDIDFAYAPKATRSAATPSRWEAYSPLPEVKDGIVPGARVLEIGLSNGQVDSVTVEHDSRVTEISTSRVVLCAGTIESSRLAISAMVRSGVRERPELTGLVDKIAQGFVVSAQPDGLPEAWRRLAAEGSLLVAPAPMAASANIFVQAYMSGAGVAVFDFYIMGEQTRGAWSILRCDDSAQPGRTVVSAEYGPADRDAIAEQRHLLQRVWNEVADRFGADPTTLDFTDPIGSADLRDGLLKARSYDVPHPPHTYSFGMGSELHEAGTLPFGEVLTDAGEVRGVEGLFVGGPAAFPRTGAANPTLTILALAKRLGAHLADTSTVDSSGMAPDQPTERT